VPWQSGQRQFRRFRKLQSHRIALTAVKPMSSEAALRLGSLAIAYIEAAAPISAR
jgi:hypothetical protein